MRRAIVGSIFVLSLLPSAYLAWQGRDLPHLGSFHDDAIYLGTARTLALGGPYRIDSLPWTPAQTKYPPLYPLYLSIAWRMADSPDQALPLAMLLNWLWLPVFVVGVYRLLLVNGQPQPVALSIAALSALHPEMQMASTRLMSDLMFAALAIWSLALATSSSAALAALAYLTRSAGLPLFAGLAGTRLLARQWRQAGVLLTTAALTIGAWTLWVSANKSSALTAVEKYYTDYFAYQWQVVPLASLPAHLYQQLDPLVAAVSRTLLLNFGDALGWVLLSRIAFVASVAGIVRLMRRGQLTAYGTYALFSTLMMLVWYFPPDTRALLPLLPLIAVGFYTESSNFTQVLTKAWSKGGAGRVVAVILALLFASLPLGMLANARASLTMNGAPMFASERRFQPGLMAAYRWIEANTPAETSFFTVDDPVFHLYTHRRALRLPELALVFERGPGGDYRPSATTLAAMDQFHLACLFVAAKHFNPDPNEPNAPLRFSVAGTGLAERYRTPMELVACRPVKEQP